MADAPFVGVEDGEDEIPPSVVHPARRSKDKDPAVMAAMVLLDGLNMKTPSVNG